ncbi:TfoX/Sxy family protein [Jannaschia sp. CCS1]|uniref:TfoX/Sxy family protein n=1 Tax=Jannaschia sp. (strain CCS1) TaxID=290400 RepID=UPI000053AC8F|nr:TfoX/Sxy family protein [Jannaschia sp. CCS1]ABD55443.1 TfoX-like protein [Jannaschia sp. CCS1]
MSVSDEEIAHALELFDSLGDLTTRKMMGGLCIYHRGTIFALLMSDGQLYLKGAGDFHDVLKDAGCTRWTYQREGAKRKPTAMPYWTMPDAALDDPEEAVAWARRALEHL